MFVGGTDGSWQANNVTDELRERGLPVTAVDPSDGMLTELRISNFGKYAGNDAAVCFGKRL